MELLFCDSENIGELMHSIRVSESEVMQKLDNANVLFGRFNAQVEEANQYRFGITKRIQERVS
jgi:hypothetical protein